MIVPKTPNNSMVVMFWKNRFFFTWNLQGNYTFSKPIQHSSWTHTRTEGERERETIPSIENDRRKQIEEEQVLTKRKQMRTLSLTHAQNHRSRRQPLCGSNETINTNHPGVQVPFHQKRKMQGKRKQNRTTYQEQGSYQLVGPPVPVQEVTDDNAGAQQSKEHTQCNHGGYAQQRRR